MNIYIFKLSTPAINCGLHVANLWYLIVCIHAADTTGITSFKLRAKQSLGQRKSGKQVAPAYLAPYKHSPKHHLEAIKEVVPNDDDHGSSCGPAFTWANGFDAGGS